MLEGWIVEPTPEVKAAAARIQDALRAFEWLEPVPEHFLHVWLGLPERLGRAPEHWRELAPFEIGYAHPTCFHNAVVVEVTPTLRRLVAGTQNDLPEFLPHLTLAVTRAEHDPAELRDILKVLHAAYLAAQLVAETKLVRFPASQSTLFQPWEVVQTVRLGERAP